jgi:hypothetical protein
MSIVKKSKYPTIDHFVYVAQGDYQTCVSFSSIKTFISIICKKITIISLTNIIPDEYSIHIASLVAGIIGTNPDIKIKPLISENNIRRILSCSPSMRINSLTKEINSPNSQMDTIHSLLEEYENNNVVGFTFICLILSIYILLVAKGEHTEGHNIFRNKEWVARDDSLLQFDSEFEIMKIMFNPLFFTDYFVTSPSNIIMDIYKQYLDPRIISHLGEFFNYLEMNFPSHIIPIPIYFEMDDSTRLYDFETYDYETNTILKKSGITNDEISKILFIMSGIQKTYSSIGTSLSYLIEANPLLRRFQEHHTSHAMNIISIDSSFEAIILNNWNRKTFLTYINLLDLLNKMKDQDIFKIKIDEISGERMSVIKLNEDGTHCRDAGFVGLVFACKSSSITCPVDVFHVKYTSGDVDNLLSNLMTAYDYYITNISSLGLQKTKYIYKLNQREKEKNIIKKLKQLVLHTKKNKDGRIIHTLKRKPKYDSLNLKELVAVTKKSKMNILSKFKHPKFKSSVKIGGAKKRTKRNIIKRLHK